MTLEVARSSIAVNGISVPGFDRNGLFIGESPVTTYLLFRSGAFAAGQAKSFMIEFPCIPRAILFNDTLATNTYNISILTSDGTTWAFVASGANITSFGNMRSVALPAVVLDKGAKVTITPTSAIQGFIMSATLAYNIEVKDF